MIAGQVETPRRWVPFATVGSLVASCSLYVLLMWACVATLPHLATASAPLAEAGSVLGGAAFGRLVVAGTSISALGICLGMMVTTPRYLSALARGRKAPLRPGAIRCERRAAAGPGRDLGTRDAGGPGRKPLGPFRALSLAVVTQFGVTAAALFFLALRRERGLRPATPCWRLLPSPSACTSRPRARRATRDWLPSLRPAGSRLVRGGQASAPVALVRRPSPPPSGRGPSWGGSRRAARPPPPARGRRATGTAAGSRRPSRSQRSPR